MKPFPLDNFLLSMIEYGGSHQIWTMTLDSGWWIAVDTGVTNVNEYLDKLMEHIGREHLRIQVMKGMNDGQ